MGRALRGLRRVEPPSSRKRWRARPGAKPSAAKPGTPPRLSFVGLEGATAPPPRTQTAIAELDRVLGGGLVAASAVLVGGDPGIGKSTLLLQAAASLARPDAGCCTSPAKNRSSRCGLRARRLGLADATMELAATINVRDIAQALEQAEDAALVVIDSIQTMWLDSIESAPGTVRAGPRLPASS